MGKKYGQFDKTGRPLGFYCEEDHGENIPKDAIAIDEDDWKAYLTGLWLYSQKGPIPVPQPTAAEAAKETAQTLLWDSDKKMARVTEDLIDLLLAKDVLQKKDLPSNLVAILDDRKAARLKVK